jgi:hypothetical protein
MHVACGYGMPCRALCSMGHARAVSELSASCLPAPPLDHSARTVESLKALLADAALCLACCVLIDLLRLVLDNGEIYAPAQNLIPTYVIQLFQELSNI